MFPLSCAFLVNARAEPCTSSARGLGCSFHEFVVADSGNDGAYVPRCADARSVSLGARQAVTASGQNISVTERTIPLQVTLVTPCGPAPLPPISFAIMPGSDGVLLGLPTPKDLGVDPYERI